MALGIALHTDLFASSHFSLSEAFSAFQRLLCPGRSAGYSCPSVMKKHSSFLTPYMGLLIAQNPKLG